MENNPVGCAKAHECIHEDYFSDFHQLCIIISLFIIIQMLLPLSLIVCAKCSLLKSHLLLIVDEDTIILQHKLIMHAAVDTISTLYISLPKSISCLA